MRERKLKSCVNIQGGGGDVKANKGVKQMGMKQGLRVHEFVDIYSVLEL